jgi:hypothetical protein
MNKSGFEVMVLADQNLRWQQRLVGRKLGLVIIASKSLKQCQS